jgi:hypothetical protein
MAVCLHFVVGCLAMFPLLSPLRHVPLIGSLVTLYEWNSFRQTWLMFAPPPRSVISLGYSLRFEDGWTELGLMDDKLYQQAKGRLVVARGASRVATHLRPPLVRRDADLDKDGLNRDYLQKLGSYYCQGDGQVPGLLAIRFYIVVKGVRPFHRDLENGKPAPLASDYDSVDPLYERACGD